MRPATGVCALQTPRRRLQAQVYRLQVRVYRLQVLVRQLQVQVYRLQVLVYRLQVLVRQLQVPVYRLQVLGSPIAGARLPVAGASFTACRSRVYRLQAPVYRLQVLVRQLQVPVYHLQVRVYRLQVLVRQLQVRYYGMQAASLPFAGASSQLAGASSQVAGAGSHSQSAVLQNQSPGSQNCGADSQSLSAGLQTQLAGSAEGAKYNSQCGVPTRGGPRGVRAVSAASARHPWITAPLKSPSPQRGEIDIAKNGNADPSRVGEDTLGNSIQGRYHPIGAAPMGTPVCPWLFYSAPSALRLDALRATAPNHHDSIPQMLISLWLGFHGVAVRESS